LEFKLEINFTSKITCNFTSANEFVFALFVIAGLRRTTQLIYTQVSGKVAHGSLRHGPRKIFVVIWIALRYIVLGLRVDDRRHTQQDCATVR